MSRTNASLGQPPAISVPAYLVLGAITMITPLATNMYVPALPALATSFGVTAATAQFTVSATLIGIVVGQLAIGSISDRVGRRMPALVGTALFVVSSILCAAAPSMPILIGCRFLEGFAGASGVVLARASIRDRVDGRQAAQALSRLLIVAAIGPIIGPFLGSLALRFTDWRGVFLALAGAGAVAFLLALRWFPETLPARSRLAPDAPLPTRPDRREQSRAWRRLIGDRHFWSYVVIAGLLGAMSFTWLSSGSFFMNEIYGTDATGYSLLVGFTSLCFLIGAWLNSRAVLRIGPRHALLRGLVVIALGATLLLSTTIVQLPFVVALLGIGVTIGAYGGMIANAQALGMARHGDAAGAASAFLGASQFLFGALIPPIVTLAFGFTWAMPATILFVSATAFTITALQRGRRSGGLQSESTSRPDDRELNEELTDPPVGLDPETAL